MINFKQMVAHDVHKVFLNTNEFAEKRTVRYDGVEYPDISVVLEGPVEKERDRLADDHIQGLHLAAATLYCAREDLGGKLPEHGTALAISTREGGRSFRKYCVVASTDNMGMLHVELEAVEQ